MKRALHRSFGSTVQQFNGRTILVCALLFPLAAGAQFSTVETGSARSASGQFIVIGGQAVSRLASLRAVATNADLVRLEPALLAVSAERLKESLRQRLGISRSAGWSGKIFLDLHPARSLNEDVNVSSTRFLNNWNYRVELPDVVSRTRLLRAMTAVLLLEFADRGAGAHPAEIPAWLTDGLSQQLATAGLPGDILSPPDKIIGGLDLTEIDAAHRGVNPLDDARQGLHFWTFDGSYGYSAVDPLADVRRVLEKFPALTFEQLSWPDGAQVSGADGGAYRASAKLFVSSLLGLKDGPARLRMMLQKLPQCYNWQTAFLDAFREDFSTQLDVEKWWALQVVDFSARDPGPQWTPAASRDRLDEILSVPVEMRAASNDLPSHAEISLQAVIRNFDSDQQEPVLQARLR
ncbi:MAG TPA: hypothetical protein VMV89_09400, partial [Candidatus Paceibacterota bacterium]|nr:hypothetical protein [Candidatus Paceibacterota bacterium]